MTTTPTSLLSTSLLSTSLLIQSTRQTLIKCQSMNKTRPSGGSRRSIVGRQSSYFIIQEASQLNVTPGMSHGVEVSAVSAWLSVSHITVFYYELTESHFSSYCFKQVYRRWYESHRSSSPNSGWNSYTPQCGTIMTLILPGDCTLQCGMWSWNHDSELPLNLPGGSTLQCDT